MSRPDPIPLPADPQAERRAAARALIEARIAMLTRVAEVGMGIVEDAGRRSAALAAGETARPGETDPGLTYARAARAVRLTIALQTRLLESLESWGRLQGKDLIFATHDRRGRIQRLVERAIVDQQDDGCEIERLCGEAREWLQDDEDDFGDILDRPIGEIVTRICRDLGLSPEVSAWAMEASGGAADDNSLPFMGRVAAKPPGGASEWNDGLSPIPHPSPFGVHPPHEGEGLKRSAGSG